MSVRSGKKQSRQSQGLCLRSRCRIFLRPGRQAEPWKNVGVQGDDVMPVALPQRRENRIGESIGAFPGLWNDFLHESAPSSGSFPASHRRPVALARANGIWILATARRQLCQVCDVRRVEVRTAVALRKLRKADIIGEDRENRFTCFTKVRRECGTRSLQASAFIEHCSRCVRI